MLESQWLHLHICIYAQIGNHFGSSYICCNSRNTPKHVPVSVTCATLCCVALLGLVEFSFAFSFALLCFALLGSLLLTGHWSAVRRPQHKTQRNITHYNLTRHSTTHLHTTQHNSKQHNMIAHNAKQGAKQRPQHTVTGASFRFEWV